MQPLQIVQLVISIAASLYIEIGLELIANISAALRHRYNAIS